VLDKVVIVGGSNNAGIWGRSPRRCGNFLQFFIFKKYAFLSIFSAKNAFINDCKKYAGAPQGACPLCPTSLATPLGLGLEKNRWS